MLVSSASVENTVFNGSSPRVPIWVSSIAAALCQCSMLELKDKSSFQFSFDHVHLEMLTLQSWQKIYQVLHISNSMSNLCICYWFDANLLSCRLCLCPLSLNGKLICSPDQSCWRYINNHIDRRPNAEGKGGGLRLSSAVEGTDNFWSHNVPCRG